MRSVICFFIATIALFSSCSDDKDTPTSVKLNIDRELLTFNKLEEQAVTQTFQITSNTKWTIESPQDEAVSLDKVTGEGDAQIAVTVDPTKVEHDGEATLSIKAVKGGEATRQLVVKYSLEEIVTGLDRIEDAKFKAYLIDDIFNGKTTVSQQEIDEVTEIAIIGKGIESLKGIEIFTNLKVLKCSQNSLKLLDLSKNLKLTTLGCAENELKVLDLPNSGALMTLLCSNNVLEELDLSNQAMLTFLNCSGNSFGAGSVKIQANVYNGAVLTPQKGNSIYQVVD